MKTLIFLAISTTAACSPPHTSDTFVYDPRQNVERHDTITSTGARHTTTIVDRQTGYDKCLEKSAGDQRYCDNTNGAFMGGSPMGVNSGTMLMNYELGRMAGQQSLAPLATPAAASPTASTAEPGIDKKTAEALVRTTLSVSKKLKKLEDRLDDVDGGTEK